MKKAAVICITFLFVIISSSAKAQDYKTSLGVRLSSAGAMVNNSVSVKHFLFNNTAIEGLLSFGDPLAIGVLLEKHQSLNSPGLKYFYGAGGYLGFVKTTDPSTQKTSTEPNVGAQGIIGLDYKFANVPLNLSLDWKPELNIIGDINFEPSAIGFSARFTF